ncbi:hypothetical protein DFH06DRAFT_1159123 [Mycena polygramma]|nr:hypothetical protein DFH06DRAFT_1159123 [Mycena polygramma]
MSAQVPSAASSQFALSPRRPVTSSRQPEYQNQYRLVNINGRLRFDSVSTHALALPPEIVAQIFMHCLPAAKFIAPNITAAPLILCGVCRLWREVALSTPRLWNSLFLSFDLMLRKGAYVDLYQMWLSRARGSPLSLRLQGSSEKQVPAGPVKSLLNSIIGLSQQWQKMKFNFIYWRGVASFLLPVQGKLPLLESLSISIFFPVDVPITFMDAPKLRSVVLLKSNRQIQAQWHQLATLTSSETITSCLQVLHESPNLIDGAFTVCYEPFAPPVSALEHTHLQSLSLRGVWSDDDYEDEEDMDAPMLILSCLTTPNLKILSLQSRLGGNTVDVFPFLSSVTRSSAQIHTLALSSMPGVPETLIECLKATPSLVVLKLKPPKFDLDPVFAQFTGLSDFLPKLKSLHIVLPQARTLRWTVPTLVEMLCWRWAAVGTRRLQSFRLVHPYELTFGECITAHPEVQRLEAEGMVLYVGQESCIDSF